MNAIHRIPGDKLHEYLINKMMRIAKSKDRIKDFRYTDYWYNNYSYTKSDSERWMSLVRYTYLKKFYYYKKEYIERKYTWYTFYEIMIKGDGVKAKKLTLFFDRLELNLFCIFNFSFFISLYDDFISFIIGLYSDFISFINYKFLKN